MRLIVLGSGSIAKQHLKNLKDIELELLPLRESESLNFLENNTLDPEYDLCLICTSSYLHDQIVIRLCEKEIPFYCEKPFLLQETSLAIFQDTAFKKVFSKSCVGFNLRYHPGVQRLKQIIKTYNNKDLSFEIHVGSDVTTWRSDRTIDDLYSLDNQRGGGAVSELSHELDLATFLFSNLEVLYISSIPDPWLNNVDGSTKVLLKGQNNVHGSVSMDIVSPVLNRFISITGKDLHLNLDLVKSILSGEIEKQIVNEEFLFNRNSSLEKSLLNFIKFNQKDSYSKPINLIYNCQDSTKIINEIYNKRFS